MAIMRAMRAMRAGQRTQSAQNLTLSDRDRSEDITVDICLMMGILCNGQFNNHAAVVHHADSRWQEGQFRGQVGCGAPASACATKGRRVSDDLSHDRAV